MELVKISELPIKEITTVDAYVPIIDTIGENDIENYRISLLNIFKAGGIINVNRTYGDGNYTLPTALAVIEPTLLTNGVFITFRGMDGWELYQKDLSNYVKYVNAVDNVLENGSDNPISNDAVTRMYYELLASINSISQITHQDIQGKNDEVEYQHITQGQKESLHTHTNKASLDNYNPTLFATALQGEKADSALQSLPAGTIIDADYPALKSKVNGIEPNANNYSLPTATDTVSGGIKVGSRLTVTNGVLSANVQSDNNFNSTYKTKLDGIASNANNYTHPANHPATIITQTEEARFVTDTEKSTWNGKATQATIDTAIDAIEVGGRNLIPNTKDLTGHLYGTSDTYLGFNISRTTRGATGYLDTFSTTTIDIAGGSTYIASFYARASVTTPMDCYWYNPDSTTSSLTSTGYASYSPDGDAIIQVTTEWKKYWVVWTQTLTELPKKLIIGRNGTIAGAVLEIAGVKLEKGNKATDWTPAPEEQVTDWNVTDVNSFAYLKNKPITDIISTNADNNTGTIVIDTTPNWHRVYISGSGSTLILDYVNGVLPIKNREYLLVINSSIYSPTTILTLPTETFVKNGITYNFNNTTSIIQINPGGSIEVNVVFFFIDATTCNIRTQITQFI